jgi:hypothetical protein
VTKKKKPYQLTSEQKLELYRFAASQGLKKKRSIPTSGTLIGVVPRENSREFRYSWDIHNEHPYLRIQEFQFDIRTSTWHPVKGKCYTVRVHELEKVYGFLQEAIDLAAAQAVADLGVSLSDEHSDVDLIKDYDQMDFK